MVETLSFHPYPLYRVVPFCFLTAQHPLVTTLSDKLLEVPLSDEKVLGETDDFTSACIETSFPNSLTF